MNSIKKFFEKRTTFNGGHFEYEETRIEAHRIMRLSLLGAVLICLYTLYRILDPSVVEAASIGDEPAATFYLREVAFLIISLSIPLCGYFGAKNENLRTLRIFCISSFTCALLSAISAGLAAGLFCSVTATCSTAALSAICVYIVACVLYAMVSYFSSDILFLEHTGRVDLTKVSTNSEIPGTTMETITKSEV